MEKDAEGRLTKDRMIEAAMHQQGDPGWSAKITTSGINITYTWQHMYYHPFTGRQIPGEFYTVEAFCPWTTLARAPKNPLLSVMADMLKQKAEYKV